MKLAPHTLYQIALNETYVVELRERAIKYLDDQQNLEHIASNRQVIDNVRVAAIKKLANQELLAQLAKKRRDTLVGNSAIQRLNELNK